MSISKPPAREQSRACVLRALRDAATPQEISALCEATGLSAGAIRFHLTKLLRAGSIHEVREDQHARPGRPAIRYAALPDDAADPAAAYRMLAAMLAAQLGKSPESRTLASAVGRDWVRAQLPQEAGSRDRPALSILRTFFQESGFAPALADDGRTLELHHCPYREVAALQPDVVCSVHHGLAVGALENAGITGNVRVMPVVDGSGPCLVRVRAQTNEEDRLNRPVTSTKENFA